MKGFFSNDMGKVYIEPSIVTRLCIMPELSLSGEFVLPSGPVSEDPVDQVTRKGVDRYILVDFNQEGEVIIEVRLLVRYGPSIRASAALFQEKLIRKVESATGLHVARVDIKVDGIFRPVPVAAGLPSPREESRLQLENRNSAS
jgi:uncharacterized alkaline shock family protein YloU